MVKSDNLFSLIKSLTKNERRYFQIHASLHVIGKTNNYVLLYDAISKQKIYDEVSLKNQLKRSIPSKHFGVVKNYLYNMILKFLHIYHSEESINLRLKKLIHFAQILYDKTLYDQCKTILDKVEKLALDFDQLQVLLEVYEWRSKIMRIRSFESVNEKDIIELNEKEWLCIEKIKKEKKYAQLNTTLFFKMRKTGVSRSKQDMLSEYVSLINNPLFRVEQEAETIQSKLFFYNTFGTYHFISGDARKAIKYYSKQLAFFEKNPIFIDEYFDSYQATLFNLIVGKIGLKAYDDVPLLINKMEESRTQTLLHEIRNFEFINLLKINFFINTIQFEKIITLITSIDKGIKKFDRKMSTAHRYSFNLNIGCSYLILGNHKDALLRFNTIINNPQSNLLDIQSFTRILSLIAHYELKQYDQLPYLIRSTYRFLIKKRQVFEFEKILIRYIKKLAHIPDDVELKKLLSQFKDTYSALINDSNGSMAIQYFDFISWVESKIENRPMIDIIKRKYKG